MSKQDINYACGHDGVINIVGPKRNREYVAKSESRKLCPECYSAKLAADRAAASAAAAEQAKATGLPALTGSAKQIAWAETIRANAVAQLAKLSAYLDEVDAEPDAPEQEREEARIAREIIANVIAQTDASTWIDNQYTQYEGVWMRQQIWAWKKRQKATIAE